MARLFWAKAQDILKTVALNVGCKELSIYTIGVMTDASTPVLNAVEVRVLGALVEKDATTPDYYPLSLNALVNACNQKSNRDPVMTLDESTVRDSLESLHDKGLAGPAGGADSRVTKYEHRAYDALKLGRREVAVICELLLRGAQTPGELRGRAERMHPFEGIEDVLSTLQRLMQREPPLVAMLPRQPGTKESRYTHLMSGEVAAATEVQAPMRSVSGDRVGELEIEVAELRKEVHELKQQLEEFRRKFE
jgi:hypothetical protein